MKTTLATVALMAATAEASILTAAKEEWLKSVRTPHKANRSYRKTST